MEINEIVVSIIIFLVGLFAAVGKKVSPYPRTFIVAATLAIVIQVDSGTLESVVFFFCFLPLLFLQRSLSQGSKKKESSSVSEKFFAYMATLPIFGMAFIYREKISEFSEGWAFPNEFIPAFEISLILITIFWTIEWTKKGRRKGYD